MRGAADKAAPSWFAMARLFCFGNPVVPQILRSECFTNALRKCDRAAYMLLSRPRSEPQ